MRGVNQMRIIDESIIDKLIGRGSEEVGNSIKVITSRDKCEECGGSGRVFNAEKGRYEECQKCSNLVIDTKKELEKFNGEVEVSEVELERYLKENNAPVYVYDKDYKFDIEELKGDILKGEDITSSVEFTSYIRKLNSLNLKAVKGELLNKSYMISSDRGFGKTHLQWSILKEYYKKGIKVSPAFLTEDLYEVKKNKSSLHELVMRYDIIQVNLMGSLDIKRNIYILLELMEKCKFENKPVIIYTLLNSYYFNKWDGISGVLRSKSPEGYLGLYTVIEYHRPYEKVKETYKGNKNKEPFSLGIEDIGLGLNKGVGNTEAIEGMDFNL